MLRGYWGKRRMAPKRVMRISDVSVGRHRATRSAKIAAKDKFCGQSDTFKGTIRAATHVLGGSADTWSHGQGR